jgi:hypothetical protein
MILGVNKQIFQLKRNGDGTYCTELVNKKWIEKSYYKYLLGTIQYSELKPNSTLYFSKSSSFPRLKLENSCFKRCIKISKADYVVVDPSSITTNDITVQYFNMGDDMCIVTTYDLHYRQKEIETFLGHEIPEVKLMTFYELSEKRADLIELIQHPSVKFITDDTLNKAINAGDQVLDLESMHSIHGMLSSKDIESIELGLKMLTSFNIDETPLTISTMLLMNQRWYMTNARDNVLVQNMLKQLNISNKRSSSGFPYNIHYLATDLKNNNFSENDKQMSKELIIEKTNDYLQSKISSDVEFFKNYGINVNIKVE